MCAQSLSCVQLFHNPMDCSPPDSSLSMGFFRQEYWRGLPFPPPGDLPDPGIEPACPALAGRFFTTATSGKPRLSRWEQVKTKYRDLCLKHQDNFFYIVHRLYELEDRQHMEVV